MSNKSDVSYIREYLPADEHFILSTWLKGLYFGGTLYSYIDKKTFMVYYTKVLKSIISNKDRYKIQVMCDRLDPNIIIGFSVLSKDETVLHWVQVKVDFRRHGVAADLVPATVKTVTHLTKLGILLMKNKGLAYNPFIL
jgi:hypothetical protein